jgi:hypothetical protein
MQAPAYSFDPDTVMGHVCDDAWKEVQRRLVLDSDHRGLRRLVALRVMAAVVVGQRDPARLKAIALDALTVEPGNPHDSAVGA